MNPIPSQEAKALKPCPFCGGGESRFREHGKQWLGMRYSEPASVSVEHWCDPVAGQPSRMIERVGRDQASAIEAWNTRAPSACFAGSGEAKGSKAAATEDRLPADPVIVAAKRLKA